MISFNGERQLCQLTCAGWRDPSNHTRMSMVQSRTPEKEAKNYAMLTQKFPWNSCSTTHLPFLSSNPKIKKAFPKLFPPKWSLLNAGQKKKSEVRKTKEEGGEKGKEKNKTAVSLLHVHPKILVWLHPAWVSCSCQLKLMMSQEVEGTYIPWAVTGSSGANGFSILMRDFLF